MERLAAAQGTGQACRRDRRAWLGEPVCRMATPSVAWRPRLSHGDPVCPHTGRPQCVGMAARPRLSPP